MRLLDLFCGAGGAAVGYHRAGFTDILGVDNRLQKNYPFPFVQADALEYLHRHGDEFDVIHASPPCQAHSAMNRAVKAHHHDYIVEVRDACKHYHVPRVIENVEGSPLERPSYVLCGTMFGLKVRRHRVFEVRPFPVAMLWACQCKNGVARGMLVGHRVAGRVAPGRSHPPPKTENDRREAIGVPWMTCLEARQAIPPAYTEFIGKQLLALLASR